MSCRDQAPSHLVNTLYAETFIAMYEIYFANVCCKLRNVVIQDKIIHILQDWCDFLLLTF